MADRSVQVEIRAKVDGYISGLRNAQRATKDLGAEALRSTKDNNQNLQQLGRTGLIAGGALAAGLGAAVLAAANFDKSLSGVRAVANATAEEMDNLRAAAIEAGAATVFSASEAADAQAELAKAGVSVKSILGGALAGALDLAAAGQLELADAATIAAQAMNIFKLEGSDVTHIADVLAAGANKSAADVKELGDALRQGGLVAAQTGIGLEDSVAALSAFADSALVGSDAGTSFKTMLQRLLPQSKEAGDAMESIGFNAFDAQGNFVGLAEVAGQLQVGLGKLTAEQRAATLQSIFGADAVRAANVLYEQGAAGIRDYTDAVNDQGAAARMAATQLDNLSGDVEALKGSIETGLIGAGSAGNGVLRSLTQSATGAVNAFTGLPGPVQSSAFAAGALASAALLTLGAVGTLLPKIRETREALRGLGAAGERADRGLGRASRAAVKASVAIAAIGAIGEIFSGVDSEFERFAQTVEAAAGEGTRAKIVALTKEMERLREISDRGLNTDLGFTNIHWTDFTGGAAAAGDKADALQERIEQLRHETKLQGLEASNSVSAQRELADAYANQVAPAAEDAAEAIDQYVDALQNTAEIDAFVAVAELAESFKELKKELKDAGRVTNEEKIALGGFARDVRAAAEATLEQTGSQGKANRAMREGRDRFIELAREAGYSADEARELAEQLLSIPARTDVRVDDSEVSAAVRRTRELVRLLEKAGVARSVAAGTVNKLGAQGLAAGGRVHGPGTGTSDSVPAMLSSGEHVWSAREVRGAGGHSAIESMRAAARFASGGPVVAAAPATVVRVPLQETRTHQAPVYVEHLEVADYDDFRRQEARERRFRSSPDYAGAP